MTNRFGPLNRVVRLFPLPNSRVRFFQFANTESYCGMSGSPKAVSIAIASGHRKTATLVIASDNPVLRFHARTLSLHYLLTKQHFLCSLREVLDDSGIRYNPINCSLAISLPGASSEQHLAIILESASELGFDSRAVVVIDDTAAATIAEVGDMDAVCAFAGTGASVSSGYDARFVSSDGYRSTKWDGRGPILGDKGSMFDIGISIIRQTMELLDALESLGSRQGQSLSIPLQSYLINFIPEFTSKAEVSIWLSNAIATSFSNKQEKQEASSECIDPWNIRVADLAYALIGLVDEVEEREPVVPEVLTRVKEVFSDKAADLARTTCDALEATRKSDEIHRLNRQYRVICQGVLLRECSFYFQEYCSHLRALAMNADLSVEIQLASWHPVVGAASVARRFARTERSLQRESAEVKELVRVAGLAPQLLYKRS